jgi:hypothetical protein
MIPLGMWNKFSQMKPNIFGTEKNKIRPIRKTPSSQTDDQKTIDESSYYNNRFINQ